MYSFLIGKANYIITEDNKKDKLPLKLILFLCYNLPISFSCLLALSIKMGCHFFLLLCTTLWQSSHNTIIFPRYVFLPQAPYLI